MQKPVILQWNLAFKRALPLALVCMSLCFLVRFAIITHNIDKKISGDAILYDCAARNIAAGNGFSLGHGLSAERAPGYPYFLGAIYWMSDNNKYAASLAQSFLSSITCFIVVIFAMRITSSKKVSFLSGSIYAFYLPMAITDTLLVGESLFGIVAIVLIIAFDRAIRDGNIRCCVLLGLLIGVAVYVRPTALFLTFIFVVLLLYNGMKMRYAFIRFATVVLVAFLVLLPLQIRNYKFFGVFTPFPSEAGETLLGNWNINVVPEFTFKTPETPQYIKDAIRDKGTYERSKILSRIAVEQIKANPSVFFESAFKRVIKQWTSLLGPNPITRSRIAVAVFNSLLLLLLFYSMFNRKLDLVFRSYTLAFMIFITSVAFFVSSAEIRYTFWLLPLVFIMSSNGVFQLYKKYEQHRASSGEMPEL